MSDNATPIGRLKLENVRLSFPDLFTAKAFKPGDPLRFKATFLVPKDSAQAKSIEKKVIAVLEAKFPKKGQAIFNQIKGNANKCCWQDGDTKTYDGYDGMMALSSNTGVRPLVIDEQRNPVSEEDGKIYAGCYVNASVDLFAYTNSGNGISAQLRGVQFFKEGDSFAAGRPADTDEFDDVAVGADSEDFS